MSLEKKQQQAKQIFLNDQLSRMRIINKLLTCYFLGKIKHKKRSSYSMVSAMKNA